MHLLLSFLFPPSFSFGAINNKMKLPVLPYTPKSSQQNRNKYQKIEETEQWQHANKLKMVNFLLYYRQMQQKSCSALPKQGKLWTTSMLWLLKNSVGSQITWHEAFPEQVRKRRMPLCYALGRAHLESIRRTQINYFWETETQVKKAQRRIAESDDEEETKLNPRYFGYQRLKKTGLLLPGKKGYLR